MYVLGISCFYHDSAAALLEEGRLVAAASEERFSRIKNDNGFPDAAVRFCLRRAGIEPADLSYVVYYEKPLRKFERILSTALRTYPRSRRLFSEAMVTWFDEKLWIRQLITRALPGVRSDRILFCEHHLSHAASAFLCSPFEEAAILTVDGVGEWTTSTVGVGRGSEVRLEQEIRFPHSLGLLYSTFTAFLGFRVNEGEYKVMGMAPFGEPKFLDELHRIAKVAHDGSLWLDLDYFSFHRSTSRPFSSRFLSMFGPPRSPGTPFTLEPDPRLSPRPSDIDRDRRYADIAASIQTFCEEVLLRMADHATRESGLDALCMAGGVALNSSANGRLLRESSARNLFVQPAAGDAGGALGAALWAWHSVLGNPREFVLTHASHGAAVSQDDARRFFDDLGVRYETLAEDALTERVVDDLARGKIVGWCRGRFEWGPRALGNRSILANPASADVKRTVNERIKYREPFRPFSPAVLEETAPRLFVGPPGFEKQQPLRFMLSVLPWKPEAARRAPAVDHYGTGRLQTVRREWNPVYHDVIDGFSEATGVPAILNTSFNVRGEPIVNTAGEAFRTFREGALDVLVVEGLRVVRGET